MGADSCQCGLIVVASSDLDEVGLCVLCAGSGHEHECGCVECSTYRVALDEGAAPDAALAEALRSAG